MARLPIASRRRRRRINSILCTMVVVLITLFMNWLSVLMMYSKYRKRILTIEEKSVERMQYLFRLIRESDSACISQLRMDRRTFSILCELVRDVGGLRDTKNMTLQEIVAIFVYVLAHHKKNRTVSHKFLRSGETVSHHFNQCLLAILKLHPLLLKTPEPISDDCTDDRWKCFKNCLGALDGTLITVTPPAEHKSRYQSRKANLSTNVLGVCAPDMQFIYVLSGWEGSAHDRRVLRDAISRPNGLKVPQGCYYLVDASYCNSEGFLAPYRGQRYHLNQIHGRRPESAEGYFNMKHSKARNVIERCFGLLKGRWTILASPTFFPIQTQGRIILACCLLQNLIRRTMSVDPQELRREDGEDEDGADEENEDDDEEKTEVECISVVASSDEWTNFRNNLAQQMYNAWRNSREDFV